MKTVKELFEIAKKVFAGEDPKPEAMEAKSYKLQDGTEVSVEQAGDVLAVGDVVKVGDAPAPEGEHILEDGTTISVDAAGVITEIEAAEPAPAPVSVEVPPAPVQMAAQTPDELNAIMAGFAVGTPEERIARLEIVCKALMNQCMGWELREAEQKAEKEAAIAAYKEGLAVKMEKQERTIKALFEVMEEVVKTPTDEPKTLTSGRRERFEQITEKREKKFERMAEALKELKKK